MSAPVTARSKKLATDRNAPLPLGHVRAIERGLELKGAYRSSLSWPALAAIMHEYHGFARSSSWWAKQLRGKVEHVPRGRSFGRT